MKTSASQTANRASLIEYFDSLAPTRDKWIKKNSYYHREVTRTLSFFIPPNASVLQIGSGTGYLLNSLNPRRGVGVDLSPGMVDIAQQKYPHLEFRVEDVENLQIDEKFDYVILSDVIGFLDDVQVGSPGTELEFAL